MTIPNKRVVLEKVSKRYQCSFSPLKQKKIMYEGMVNGRTIIVCTPSSKIHPRGNGWFDLTIKQTEILDEADVAILAVRLPEGRVNYIDYKKIRELMTDKNKRTNSREGEHWKLYVWKSHIKVQGIDQVYNLDTPKIL